MVLLVPIKIRISYSESLVIKINYLFLAYKIFPRKNKKTKKNKDLEDKNKFDKNGIFNSIETIIVIFNNFVEPIRKIVSGLRVDLINICISVASEDAHETAINYGRLCALFYPTIKTILDNNKPKRYTIKIFPNFKESKTELNLDIKFGISAFNLLKYSMNGLVGFVKYYIKKAKKGVQYEWKTNKRYVR